MWCIEQRTAATRNDNTIRLGLERASFRTRGRRSPRIGRERTTDGRARVQGRLGLRGGANRRDRSERVLSSVRDDTRYAEVARRASAVLRFPRDGGLWTAVVSGGSDPRGLSSGRV